MPVRRRSNTIWQIFSENGGRGGTLVDCPTQLTLMTRICKMCSMTNTSEKYERTQQGNLLGVPPTLSDVLRPENYAKGGQEVMPIPPDFRQRKVYLLVQKHNHSLCSPFGSMYSPFCSVCNLVKKSFLWG